MIVFGFREQAVARFSFIRLLKNRFERRAVFSIPVSGEDESCRQVSRRLPRVLAGTLPRGLFLLLLSAFSVVQAAPELVDRIVAVVDNQAILWSELNYRLHFELEQRGYADYVDPQQLHRLRENILEEMIDEQVLVLKAQKDNIAINASEVEELLNEQFRFLKSSMPEAEFAQMLERVGLTERQLKLRYRREIRHRLLYRQLRTELAYRQHITRREVEAFRLAHQDTLPPLIAISHLYLKVRPSEAVLAEKRAAIDRIRQQLADGEEFEALARTYSQDPGTALQGGYLGCFGRGQLMPEFEETAFALQPGEDSEAVLTRHGYHLIRVLEKQEDTVCASHILIVARSTEADRERVRRQLEELRRRAQTGEEFAGLARTYSQNRQTAMRGGMWDLFSRDELPVFLKNAVHGLKLGEISDPFFLDDGGHIVKLNDDQSTLETMIREVRTAEAVEQLIEEYKKELHVENRLHENLRFHSAHDSSGYISQKYWADQAAQ